MQNKDENSSRESSPENIKRQAMNEKELENNQQGISLEVLEEQDDEQVLSELYGLYE